MRRMVVVGLLAIAALSGCAGPAPAVTIDAHVEKDQDGWVLVAEAVNADDSPIDYRDGCRQAWEHGLFQGEDEVDVVADPCHGFAKASLAPGDAHALRVHWDGRQWNQGHREKASEGTYVWHVQFHAYDGRLLASEDVRFGKGG